jgi:hypothetical protein
MEDLGYHPMLKEYALEDGTRTDKTIKCSEDRINDN